MIRTLLLFGSGLALLASGHRGNAIAAETRFFTIRVVDEQTGRGVPLVQLQTVNAANWWTDSAGIVAFDEPGLMNREVFFHISSPGYEYPKDFFDNRGVKLRPTAGGRADVKLKRLNIAERLYRVTGQGIYRDSVLAGLPAPLREPVLNGEVMGQDTVIATPYRGRIYWFWGDTERASYPLGNFGASGATSELPDRGGLVPSVGVDLTYFTNGNGFSRPMCALEGPGPKWIEGIFTLRNKGGEQLLARVSSQKGLTPAYEWNFCLFNDAKAQFESIARWDWQEGHDSAHPFRARVNGVEYFYLYPNLRVRAELEAMRALTNYEAFTCVAGDGKLHGAATTIDRDAAGRPRYSWKAGADRLHAGRVRELEKAGRLRPGERWLHLHDVETGAPIETHRGSVFWNDYRQRWIMIVAGKPGEVWFSEADTPTGPWAYARRIGVHGRYNFYNPTQHPFFDEEGGRVIYFEGTYTASFSGAPSKTPRYDYNQIMYRLALDDPRLALPAPIYLVKKPGGARRRLMRDAVEAERAWDRIEEISFFAIPPTRPAPALLQIYSEDGFALRTNAPAAAVAPMFLASPLNGGTNQAALLPLAEFARSAETKPPGAVWRNPLKTLALDFKAQPVN